MAGRMLLLAALALGGPSLQAQEKAKGKVYKTPQEVFEAARDAAARGDYKGYFATMAPQTIEHQAARFAVAGAKARQAAGSDPSGKLGAPRQAPEVAAEPLLLRHHLLQ